MSSSSSDTSGHSEKRNVRRRLSSFSPPERGRSRSFSHEAKERKGRRSRSRSISRRRRRPRSRNRSRAYRGDDAIRSLSRSRSRSVDRMDTSEETKHWYNDKNADGYGSAQRASLYRSAESPSRSPSPRKRDVRKSPVYGRRSPSPYAGRGPRRSPSVSHWQNNANDRYGYRGGKNTVLEERSSERAVPAAPPPQRERSLSPYSKRVALTKAMQGR